MNTKALQKHYDKLTAPERFAALIAAIGRDDSAEERALVDSAPKVLFEFPNTYGLARGFDRLVEYHVMGQLGFAGTFFLLMHLTGGNQAIEDGEGTLTLTARRFLEGREAFRAVCQEYNIDPEILTENYNLFPELTEFTEVIVRRAFEMSGTELTDLEAVKNKYRELIAQARKDGAEERAKPAPS